MSGGVLVLCLAPLTSRLIFLTECGNCFSSITIDTPAIPGRTTREDLKLFSDLNPPGISLWD
jgi:hypothetical protein